MTYLRVSLRFRWELFSDRFFYVGESSSLIYIFGSALFYTPHWPFVQANFHSVCAKVLTESPEKGDPLVRFTFVFGFPPYVVSSQVLVAFCPPFCSSLLFVHRLLHGLSNGNAISQFKVGRLWSILRSFHGDHQMERCKERRQSREHGWDGVWWSMIYERDDPCFIQGVVVTPLK